MPTREALETIHGAPSHVLETDLVKLAVTAVGGHLAPVEFRLGERKVSPYSLAPWQPGEVDPALPVLLTHLRGDFLCLPFGPQENAPPHGETANHEWSLIEQTDTSLLLHMDPSDVGACVKKSLSVRPGETAIYVDHRIRKLDGAFSYGNHPNLDLSHLPDGAGRVTVSPFRWASVYPGWFSAPADGASQALEPGAHFSDLRAVPLAAGGTADLTRYPARPGNDDLVMMVNEPATAEQPFAWSAVVMDGFVWFSLKNPEDFPATLFWMSHGGRSAPPWESRHTGRLGIEEVCSYFCDGVEVSRQNLLLELGIPTVRHFKPDEAVSLRIIQAAAPVPQGFGAVAGIRPDGNGAVVLTDESGAAVTSAVDWRFVL